MATLKANLTDNLIKNYASAEVTRFRDPRYPLILKMHTSLTVGSWYLVDFKRDKWHKFGTWPVFNCKKALGLVPDLMVKLELDKPVVTDQFDTVGQLLNWYLDRETRNAKVSKKRRINVVSSLSKHLIPRLENHELASFDQALCERDFVWPMQEEYATGTVRMHFQLLKRIFAQAVDTGVIEQNPLTNVTFKTYIKTKIVPKPSKLSAKDEPNLACSLLNPQTHETMLCCFMLLHGTRIGETRQLRWDYIDSANKLITLPKEITKTKPLEIPLSDCAFEQLIAWHKQQAKLTRSQYVFPAKTRGCINENEANKYVQVVSGGKYTAHDLRKFCRGRWLELGIDSVIAELLLNHALSDLQQTYIQTNAKAKKREALTLWAEHLHAVKSEFETETTARPYDFNAQQPA